MKQSSNKKQITAQIAKQKTKKTSISAKTSAPVKGKAAILKNKTIPTTAKTSAAESKTQKLKTSAPTRKIEIADPKKKQIPSVQKVKSGTDTTKPKVSDAGAKTKSAKISLVVSPKKNRTAKCQKVADKVRTEKSKKSVVVKKTPAVKSQPRASAKKKTSENEKNKQIVKTEKTLKLAANTTIKKAQPVKSQTPGKTKNAVKTQPKVLTKKLKSKISEVKSKTANVKSKTFVEKKSAKKKTVIKSSRTQKVPDVIENKNQSSRISKIPKVDNQKIVAVHLVKKLKLPAGISASKSKRSDKRKQGKLIFKANQPIPMIPKSQPKKAKAISSAVFRGEKNRYDFTVFPLDAVFENVPAIYIISRRVVDKSKKAHHALVCIGQTESLLDELKKHKKDKRTKKFAANSISLLREENENRRLKIETDLKAAHAIRCLYP